MRVDRTVPDLYHLTQRVPVRDVVWIPLAILVSVILSSCSVSKSPQSIPHFTSMHFRSAGHLNYCYAPGLMIPLRDGNILALNGHLDKLRQPVETPIKAVDGKTYGWSWGMVELFDPNTGQSKLLTKMPFVFGQAFQIPSRRQMQAIELQDGRIFMVGLFGANPDVSVMGSKGIQPHRKLPFFSKIPPYDWQLQSIAPNEEPQLFGLIYDYKQGTFEVVKTEDQIPPRYMVSMNLLPDGKVLIIGGSVSGSHDSDRYPETRVLAFDPVKKNISVVGNLSHARFGHECLAMGNGKFMLFGGWDVSEKESKDTECFDYNPDGSCGRSGKPVRTKEVEIFDLKIGKSKVVGSTLTGRFDFKAIPLPEQKVFINGGAFESRLGYQASELFDAKYGRTSFLGVPYSRRPGTLHAEYIMPYRFYGEGSWFDAASVADKILIVGLDQAMIYDASKLASGNVEHTTDHINMPRYHHHLCVSSTGRAFVLGGLTYDAFYGSAVQREHPADLIEEFVP